MIGIIFLCWISTRTALSQSITWTVGTPVPTFGKELKLTCNVSSDCCQSFSRIWQMGSGTQILNDGSSSDPNKYAEDWDGGTAGFNLIIKNLQLSDAEVDYTCQYRVGNDKHTLVIDDTWVYPPPENCPMTKDGHSEITGEVTFGRLAPFPSVFASFGDKDVTSYLDIIGPTQFDTWFYNLTVTSNAAKMPCKIYDGFTLIIGTGTKNTTICKDVQICFPCFICGLKWCGTALLGAGIAALLLLIGTIIGYTKFMSCCYTKTFCTINCKEPNPPCDKDYIFLGTECEDQLMMGALKRSILITLINIPVFYLFAFPFVAGVYCHTCYDGLMFGGMLFGGGILCFIMIHLTTLKYLKKDMPLCVYLTIIISTIVTVVLGIVIYLIWNKCTGGKNQSVESGSSCWPICRVGQDPNTSSSDPEKVRRSPEKERADKKKDRKPTEVVRPQPTRPLPPMHLKTDNTGRAEYSTETEIFKPPALPSINKASDSPRPLPQKPPGTQLDPLSDSTSEKKKKKKRKKKEPKQSDEEN